MTAVHAIFCPAATAVHKSRCRVAPWPAISAASRLQVSAILCSARGSSNGKPGGGVDRAAAESLNGNLSSTPDDVFLRNRASYEQQELKARRTVQPASGREVPEGEAPFRLLENGQKVYLDELDVISLLEPPKYLRPFQALNYNHAAFLWKKIGDIPEERRHRLLDLLLPRQITKMWEVAMVRYDDPDLSVDDSEGLISKPALQNPGKSTVWDGRIINVPWYYKPFSRFQKVFFSKNGKVYGRVKTGGVSLVMCPMLYVPRGSVPSSLGDPSPAMCFAPHIPPGIPHGGLLEGLQAKVAPLYFVVQQAEQVMATDEFCDLKFDYGDGQLHLKGSVPPGFPEPVSHLPPFNDKTCDYIRAVGPGVVVGQGWVEGLDLEQIPRPLYGEFLMIQKFQ